MGRPTRTRLQDRPAHNLARAENKVIVRLFGWHERVMSWSFISTHPLPATKGLEFLSCAGTLRLQNLQTTRKFLLWVNEFYPSKKRCGLHLRDLFVQLDGLVGVFMGRRRQCQN